MSQELYTVGYYIFTVDGPRVTVDYYSDNHGNWRSDANYPNGAGHPDTGITPTFNFVKKETWGYSLNGKEFLVAQGESYGKIVDHFQGTTARILSGSNESTTMDYNQRHLAQVVNTGWSPETCCTASDILRLWGMTKILGSNETSLYVLSMSYDPKLEHDKNYTHGLFGLAVRDANCNWVNAVERNFGGNKHFVRGPWKPDYGLGTYGVDPRTNTAWAVINHASNEFAVAPLDEESDGCFEREGKGW